ncbi:unnamed protein product [Somion occarium]|uniref:Uncharacterized protein n=1 Tax=Somion occarium TaxID=3059160 RepID=A0ABP1CYH0_9APHY
MEYPTSPRRPSLPSLQTLCLPIPSRVPAKSDSLPPLNARDNFKLSTFEDLTRRQPMRQLSASSSMTTISSRSPSFSRSPSPSDDDNDMSPITPPKHPHLPCTKFTLVQSSFDEADAFVLVPPPSDGKSSRGYLLVGPTAEKLRRNRETARSNGARIHPYRMVPGHTASRRASLASTLSQDA